MNARSAAYVKEIYLKHTNEQKAKTSRRFVTINIVFSSQFSLLYSISLSIDESVC